MTVADAIAILLEMNPMMELVVPQAPYGHPWPLPEGFINVIEIDSSDGEFDGEPGEYCGIGFSDADKFAFCESDDLDEDIAVEEIKEVKEESKPFWDSLVPNTPDDFKKLIE